MHVVAAGAIEVALVRRMRIGRLVVAPVVLGRGDDLLVVVALGAKLLVRLVGGVRQHELAVLVYGVVAVQPHAGFGNLLANLGDVAGQAVHRAVRDAVFQGGGGLFVGAVAAFHHMPVLVGQRRGIRVVAIDVGAHGAVAQGAAKARLVVPYAKSRARHDEHDDDDADGRPRAAHHNRLLATELEGQRDGRFAVLARARIVCVVHVRCSGGRGHLALDVGGGGLAALLRGALLVCLHGLVLRGAFLGCRGRVLGLHVLVFHVLRLFSHIVSPIRPFWR